ncbi:hypothetical protein [Prevotella sp.]
MKKNKNKAYLKPITEIVYMTECTNILAGSGEMSPSVDLTPRTTGEDDAM